LAINETNETIVQPHMTFHVRLTLTDINPKPSRSVIAIGETILIKADAPPQILTSGIQRAYKEISYQLADDEEEEKGHD
jgi:hypothetical protein